MRFWDSSALVPLLVDEKTSHALELLFQDPLGVAVWWGAEVECASAIARLERTNRLTATEAAEVLEQLQDLSRVWHRIDPVETIRIFAKRFLRVHDLRAADAIQLAAAFLASEERPESLEFVCLDEKLAAAARREGFPVLDLAALP